MPGDGIEIIHLDFFRHGLLDNEYSFANAEYQLTVFRKTRGKDFCISQSVIPAVCNAINLKAWQDNRTLSTREMFLPANL